MNVVHVKSSAVAAVLLALLSAGIFNEDAPHGFRRGGEEVAAVVPAGGVGGVDEPQICLVDGGRRVQRVAGRFLGHPGCREFAQLLVDQRQKLPGGVRIALFDGGKDAGHVIHRL